MREVLVHSRFGPKFIPKRAEGLNDRENAGHDVFVPQDMTVPFFQPFVMDTGLTLQLPVSLDPLKTYYVEIYPRSSLGFNYGLKILNTVAIIDAPFCGKNDSILLKMKLTEKPEDVLTNTLSFKEGDRIAQIIFKEAYLPELMEIDFDELSDKSRNGIGSTGK